VSFAPGSRVSQVKIAERLGLSRTPVREALRQIEKDGLVVSERGRQVVISSPAAALQFPLAAPEVCSVVFGAVTATEIRENLPRLSAKIPAGFWSDPQSSGLLSDGVPVPK